ncbi:MAG: hypothetical protein GX663_03095 [Clostridiales bacterium]|nr:hypothetical protein [Clostridiales bacterium]
MENMQAMKKNLKIVMIVFAVAIIALAGRLFYIQIIGGSQLAQATHAQSLISLEGSNTRGIIYDRNGSAMVADNKRYVYIIKENQFGKDVKEIMDRLNAHEIAGNDKGYRVYSSEKYNKALGKKLIEEKQVYIVQASARYSDEQLAAHLIGYVNKKDSSGAAGLELMLDHELNLLNRHIYAVADVKGNILPGRGLIITSEREGDSSVKEGVRTSLDKEMQKAVEDILEEEENACAVVILDSSSGGVLTMASSPTFDPNNIDKYMKKGSRLVNKSTQGQYAPGSVFKIVVAAAALEYGINQSQQYRCSGAFDVEGMSIGCETGGEMGHGQISFEDAFAQSCNSYFIQLGQAVGSERIIEMAEKMGLGEKALEGYPQESSGHVMTKGESHGAGIGNLSIGQGENLVTPVQIARMTNIIASKGIDREVHLLAEDKAGGSQVMSGETAGEIGCMMEGVTERGSAEFLQMLNDSGEAKTAVKTGTAEFGTDENMKTNAWMTGYTPCRDPEFVITVLVEKGSSGSGAAGPIYKQILEYLEDSGSYSAPTLA